jgi:hypothetical protein
MGGWAKPRSLARYIQRSIYTAPIRSVGMDRGTGEGMQKQFTTEYSAL